MPEITLPQRRAMAINRADAARFLATITDPEHAFEMRLIDARLPSAYRPVTLTGYFTDPAAALDALIALSLTSVGGTYVTINPADRCLLARSYNRFSQSAKGSGTSDRDIVRRHWLLVDIDPVRPSGVSATEAERQSAFDVAKAVTALLKARNWPDPIQVDSGNGVHLYYRIDLPPDSSLVSDCLKALDKQCSTEKAEVDTSVGNAARIVKIAGTLAAKGDHCPDLGRTHRLSKIIAVPDTLEPVDPALLLALAEELRPEVKQPAAKAERGGGWSQERLQAFIDERLSEYQPAAPRPYRDGHIWVLGICPFNPAHDDKTASITRAANGALGFRCLHDSCRDHNWKALRAKFGNPTGASATTEPAPEDDPDAELIEKHGPPIHRDSQSRPVAINEEFLAAAYAKRTLILFEPVTQRFYAYEAETGLWTQQTEATIRLEVTSLAREILKVRKAEALDRKVNSALAQNVVKFLQGVVERKGVFDNRPPVIHVANGVLLLENGQATLQDFSPDFYSRNRSEILYQPGATCPRFIAELLAPALDPDDISLVQRYAGQCLIGTNPSQRLLLLRGTAGGGKSTLVTALETVIGLHNVAQMRVELLTGRFEAASFVGKTVLAGKDVKSDFLNNDAAHVIKALVGGDQLEAELKNARERLPLKGNFNVIVTSNCRLHVRLDSDVDAWQRRIIIVDYEKPRTDKPIPDFAGLLVKEEGPGILAWMVEGAIALLRELRETGRPAMTPAQVKRVEDLLCESDSVRQFVMNATTKTAGAAVTVAELQQAYHDFCDSRGWAPVSDRQFQRQVRDAMMNSHRASLRNDIKRHEKNQRGFANVALLDSVLVEDGEAA